MHLRILVLIVLILSLICLGGCSPKDGVARGEAVVAGAVANLATLTALVKDLRETKENVEAMATTLGAEKAVELIEQTDAALGEALAKVPVAEAFLAESQSVLAEMKKAAEAGSGWGKTILVGVVALLSGLTGGGGWGAIALRAGKAVLLAQLDRQRTATALAAKHAERMEKAETDADVLDAKKVSIIEQVAAGVHAEIQAARGKAA